MPRIPGLGADEFQEHGYIAAAGIQLAADEQGQGQGGYQRGCWYPGDLLMDPTTTRTRGAKDKDKGPNVVAGKQATC